MQDIGFSYLQGLNDVQRKAVTALHGPVMVIAGPGSGKTRVLTYRIAHLINNGILPWNILALTFTNKAAREMKERIETVVNGGSNKVWAGTFHSLFAKILRAEAHHLGYPNNFTIYDSDDTKSVIGDIIKSLNLDNKLYNKNAVKARISAAKSNLITPKAYVENEELMAMDRMNRRPYIHQIYQKYADRCLRAGAMDFDDLLLQMYKLLYQNPNGVRQKYQQQFQYVLVDEFQDTNYLQYEIIKILTQYPGSKYNVCIVGDDAQSIYSFRGATIENILQFEDDYENVQKFKLEQNYRSTNFIVEAANEVIHNNKKQIQKKIWTDNIEGDKIKVIKAISETEEGRLVADTITEQKNRYNMRNNDFAILYRTNGQSRVFEESLRKANIPYRIFGGMSFYQRKEIKDLLAYMRLTVNDKDDEALKRVINYPRRGIGVKTIGNIGQLADDNDMSMWQIISQIDFNARSRKSIGEFVTLINSFKRKALTSNAYETAIYISRKSGIREILKRDTSIEGQNRIENITSLLDGIKQFVEDDEYIDDSDDNTTKSLAEFLQTISLMTDSDTESTQKDTVSLMSVHAAKGLEFRSVFVTGLEENLFPSYMSLSSPDQIDEERRLFYVAITRAEQRLTLSYANSRYQYGTVRYNDVSRFLTEISDANIDNLISITTPKETIFGPPKKLIGNFTKVSSSRSAIETIDIIPSKPESIREGMKIIHGKFGQGLVKKIDEKNIATISFDQLNDNKEKRIMLKYAKLQIIE